MIWTESSNWIHGFQAIKAYVELPVLIDNSLYTTTTSRHTIRRCGMPWLAVTKHTINYISSKANHVNCDVAKRLFYWETRHAPISNCWHACFMLFQILLITYASSLAQHNNLKINILLASASPSDEKSILCSRCIFLRSSDVCHKCTNYFWSNWLGSTKW